jgi:hypothetical protein
MDKALCVGINKYAYPNALHGCVNDIKDISAELIGACGFKSSDIAMLQDQAGTAAAIKSALREFVALLKPGDRFLFWYSGHGAQLHDGDAATDVICPVDFNFTAQTSVTVQDFRDIFGKIPAGVTAVWGSDSCHSGDLEKDFYLKGVPKLFRRPPLEASEMAKLAAPKTIRTFKDISTTLPNVALMSGCESDQTSADAYINGRYNGAFTYFLLQTLKAQGGLTVPLTALVTKVQAALQENRYVQVPQLSGPPSEVARTFLQQKS